MAALAVARRNPADRGYCSSTAEASSPPIRVAACLGRDIHNLTRHRGTRISMMLAT
jgi:hypothetical protein